MQDRYVGDIGDYAKLALLREVSSGRRLGVAWWRYPDENHTEDGRHISYLRQPGEWRSFDPKVFDGLGRIVHAGDRTVSALQNEKLLPGAVFCDEVIPTGAAPQRLRVEREAWFGRVQSRLSGCDVVFLDPDNGLEPDGYSLGAISGGKCVSLAQINALAAPGRTLVVYHHQTRRKGGHLAELDHWAERLRAEGFHRVDALRARPFSPRAFFLLNADDDIRRHAASVADRWGAHMSWHPDAANTSPAAVQRPTRQRPHGFLVRLKTWLGR